jgi:hypothetical protein
MRGQNRSSVELEKLSAFICVNLRLESSAVFAFIRVNSQLVRRSHPVHRSLVSGLAKSDPFVVVLRDRIVNCNQFGAIGEGGFYLNLWNHFRYSFQNLVSFEHGGAKLH